MSNALQIAHVLDPWAKINTRLDSSIRIAWALQGRAHINWYVQAEDLIWHEHQLQARARSFTMSEDLTQISFQEERVLDLSQMDALFLRKDPPFSTDYLHYLHLLALTPERPLCVNEPDAIRAHNEKMSILEYPQWIPRTAIARKASDVKPLARQMGGRVVLKPLYLFGGKNILVADVQDRNFDALVELVAEHDTQYIMIQEFLEDISRGDVRVLALDGKMLGSFTRIAGPESYRSNVAAGGKWHPYPLNPQEQAIVNQVISDCARKGLYFVGLDLIGGKLTEINVTSPTGLPALDELTNFRHEVTIAEWVEQRVNR